MKPATLFAAALAALSCSSCAATIIRTGLPAGDIAKGYDARWHDSFLWGTLEPERPAALDSVCPRGWSEFRIEASFPAGLLQFVTLGIYTPANVTVVCASADSVYVGAPGETPLPPLCH
jgi:hypothetical protein